MMNRLAACSAVALLLAGCLGAPQQSVPSTSPPTRSVQAGGPSGFAIESLTILPDDGRNRTLREDDGAKAHFVVRNDGAAAATFFVSILVNGEVEQTQTLRLDPAQSKAYDLTFAAREYERLDIEVRAGDRRASAHADVQPWPRTGERVDLGPATITVERWLKNATTGGTDVNVSLERKALPEGDYHMLRVHVLCADAAGKVAAGGEARPPVPEPGAAGMGDIWLPGCPETLYGIDLTGLDASNAPIYTRILFVDAQWRPPAP